MTTTEHACAPHDQSSSLAAVQPGDLVAWTDSGAYGPVVCLEDGDQTGPTTSARVWLGPGIDDTATVVISSACGEPAARNIAVIAADSEDRRAKQVRGLALWSDHATSRWHTTRRRVRHLRAERAQHTKENIQQVNALQARLRAAHADDEALEAYKRRVRARVFEVAQDERHCAFGVNETLSALDLEPYDPAGDFYTVSLTITSTVEVVVRNADGNDEAGRLAQHLSLSITSIDDDVEVPETADAAFTCEVDWHAITMSGRDADAVAAGYRPR